ncbi:MAG TPA: HRDC domain-containing protein, partial [Acidimicrobiales bacterium]|nr:HRDC domain-containing protein [Acidimicrobiales bacterium]
GLDAAMQLLEGARRRVDRSAQTDDLDALVALAALHPDPDGFETWLRDSLGQAGDPQGVVLATIHAVKGREWQHVIVYGVSAGLLPHRLANDIEEERRVFHVAITRCSSSVTVVPGHPPSPFVDELTEEWLPTRPPVRGSAGSITPPSAGPRPPEEPTVIAVVDLDVEHGGHRGKVVRVTDEGVLLQVEQVTVQVAYGSMVRVRPPVGGRLARLVPQPLPTAVIHRASDALRAWRLARSRALGKPAFVVFSDATLDALAAAMPASTNGLSKIKGIGPAKLESYGDEILAVLDAVRDG